MTKTFLATNRSVIVFLLVLSLFTLAVTVMAEATGYGLIST